MLSKPKFGWSQISVSGKTIGVASYTTDVPFELLDEFYRYFKHKNNNQKANFNIIFDAEGWEFGIFEFSDNLYSISSIESYNKPMVGILLEELSSERAIEKLCEEAVNDIKADISDWAKWNLESGSVEDEEYRRAKSKLEKLIAKTENELLKYRKRTKRV